MEVKTLGERDVLYVLGSSAGSLLEDPACPRVREVPSPPRVRGSPTGD